MEQSIDVDILVIGAGFTGLSAALHLREMGIGVAVLEAEHIGFGASGRNVGLVNAGLWIRPAEVINRLGAPLGARLIGQLGDAPGLVFDLIARYQIACDTVRNGNLHCAVGAAGYRELVERARQWQELGVPVELLDAGATATKIGTNAYCASLLDRRAGIIQPLAYARGLARAGLDAGARIFTASPVRGVTDDKGRWRVEAAGGSVRAEWIIVATNTYSSAVWSPIRAELVGLPYFNLATRPLDSSERARILPERQGVWDTRRILSSLRTDAAGRLIFGSVGALRGSGIEVHRGWGRRALGKIFPGLRGVEFQHEWYGLIGMTTDAIPRFHELARNTVSISGYNGRGIAPGTTFGRDLARLVAGKLQPKELALPLTAPQRASLRTVKESFYEVGAQVAHSFGARI